MKPILLIHGYSSEGKSNTAKEIYGSLPDDLREIFGADNIEELNLSRWISLSDGVRIDDISYAMNRALTSNRYAKLLDTGFHVIIHSTGALVVRNWIKNHSGTPCPIENLVHLAGANFGSGLAHVGKGQLARWGRLIFTHTGRGTQVLDELEFGSWKTLDLHKHFLEPGKDMYKDYRVREFCIIGSEIPALLRPVPIRYIKEDSSDNTVRTSAGNLNFNYLPVKPTAKAFNLTVKELKSLVDQRLDNETIVDDNYDYDLSFLSQNREEVPYAIAYETAHFGEKMGIVSGSDNRKAVMPLIEKALQTTDAEGDYAATAKFFRTSMTNTFKRVANQKYRIIGWNRQHQYEGHAQLIFRLKDQFGVGVKNFDINFKTLTTDKTRIKLESLLEDDHINKKYPGTATFYLRTQSYDRDRKAYEELLDDVAPVNVEITGHEAESGEISYVPLNIRLTAAEVQAVVSSFQTTIIDVELARLPSVKVFAITQG